MTSRGNCPNLNSSHHRAHQAQSHLEIFKVSDFTAISNRETLKEEGVSWTESMADSSQDAVNHYLGT